MTVFCSQYKYCYFIKCYHLFRSLMDHLFRLLSIFEIVFTQMFLFDYYVFWILWMKIARFKNSQDLLPIEENVWWLWKHEQRRLMFLLQTIAKIEEENKVCRASGGTHQLRYQNFFIPFRHNCSLLLSHFNAKSPFFYPIFRAAGCWLAYDINFRLQKAQ